MSPKPRAANTKKENIINIEDHHIDEFVRYFNSEHRSFEDCVAKGEENKIKIFDANDEFQIEKRQPQNFKKEANYSKSTIKRAQLYLGYDEEKIPESQVERRIEILELDDLF